MKKSFIFFTLSCIELFCSNMLMSQWVKQNSPITNRLLCVSFVSPQIGYAAGESGKVLKTTNGGTVWNILNTGTTAALNSILFVNDTGYIFGNGPTVLRSTNGGANWTTLSLIIPGATGLGYVNSAVMFNGKNGVACGYFVANPNMKAFTARTTDAGLNWDVQQHDSITSFNSMAFTDPTTGYIVGNTNSFKSPILKTTNGGTSWFGQQSNTFSSLKSVFFANATNGYVGGTSGTVLVTTNGGETWNARNLGFYTISSLFATDTSTVYAVSNLYPSGDICQTTDNGLHWTTQLSNTQAFSSIFFANAQTGFAVGDSGHIFKTTNGGSTSVRRSPSITTQYQLEQNFPNPFNPSTTIKFHVLKTNNISVKIFDLLGQEIVTLINEQLDVGTYTTLWNAQDFSSGVYLMRMEAGNFSETKKITLVK